MNFIAMIGRVVNDPEVRYSQDGKPTVKYRIAVPRDFTNQDGKRDSDFINCVTFGKGADFAERYLKKGIKIAVQGRVQTGNYTNKDGQKVYTTDIVIEKHEFVERLSDAPQSTQKPQNTNRQTSSQPNMNDGFMTLPDDSEGLPWS